MVFNDTTNKNGLIQDCEFWLFGSNYGSISSNPDTLKLFTNLLNRAYEKVAIKILQTDTRWQWDDSTYDDFPIATATLVADQQDYRMDASFLKILGVSVKDSTGNYYPLSPIDFEDLRKRGIDPDEFYETSARPVHYDVTGDGVILYPAPASGQVTTSAGLKVFFQREPNYFASTDTSREVGIPILFHRVVSLNACLDYAIANNLSEKISTINGKILEAEKDMQRFFSKRDKADTAKITMTSTNAR